MIDNKLEPFISKRTLVILYALLAVPFATNALAKKVHWQTAVQRVSAKDPKYSMYLPKFCHNPEIFPGKYQQDLVWRNHFCESLAKKHVCFKYADPERKQCLTSLSEGINYFITRIKHPEFPAFPYLYLEYGNIFLDMGDNAKAARQYIKAIKKNRSYLPGYLKLTDAFMKMKNYTDAEKAIRMAYKIKPNSKAVQRRVKELKKLKQ